MQKRVLGRKAMEGQDWQTRLDDLELGRPQAKGPLTVIPVVGREGVAGGTYHTLEDAAAGGLARVEEVPGGGRVPRVRVVNRCDLPILLIDGEELQGAKQNRVVSLTTLVPATSALDVPVVCVEQGRWNAVGGHFTPGGAFMNPSGRARKLADVRRSLATGGEGDADQSAVWDGVQEVLRGLGIESQTQALSDAYTPRREAIEAFVQEIAVVPGQVGAAFMMGELPGRGPGDGGPRRIREARRPAEAGRLDILVLDDDPHRHAEFARQGRGHRIDHVWFVDDAINRLRRRRYDLVCLDNDLETEGCLREGREVAAFIPSMPAEMRPRAVLIHSWNSRCAREMEDSLRRLYDPGVTLVRAEFGAFRLAGPGPAGEGEADLRRWIDRTQAVGRTA